MTTINLKDLYYWYTQDQLIEVSDEVAEVFKADARYEMAYQRRLSRHKAQYSLDCDDGIEYSACLHEPTPQELLERMETFLRLWNALNSLPEIQGRRIDAHIILGKSIKEIAEAEEEGTKITCGYGPKEFLSENGHVTAVVLKKCTGLYNAEGRFAPTYDENDTITLPCDNVVLSIGQCIEWGDLLNGEAVQLGRGQGAVADALTYQTAQPDIFVGGDCYTGPKFAIDAIAAGKEAAISLHRYVHPGQTLTAGRDRRVYKALDKDHVLIETAGFDKDHRQTPGYNAAKAKTFSDARVTFTEEQVRKECARCLGCGAAGNAPAAVAKLVTKKIARK